MKRIDGLLVTGFALIYGFLSLQIGETQVGIQNRVGPGFFPLIIAGLMFFCGVIMILSEDGVDHRQVWPGIIFFKPFLFLSSIFFAYAFLIEVVGFPIVNLLTTFYVSLLLKGKLIPSIITGVIVAVITYLLFSVLLEINLPLVIFEI